MGWKELAASIISDLLSWPVAFFAAVLLLLKPLRRLLGRIRSVKGGGLDVELREDVLEAGAAALEAQQEADSTSAAQSPPSNKRSNLDGSSPERESDAARLPEREFAPSEGAQPSPQEEEDSPIWRLNVPWSDQTVERRLRGSLVWEFPVGMYDDPGEVVRWSWKQLEASLDRLYRIVLENEAATNGSPLFKAFSLRKRNVVGPSFMESINGLSKVLRRVEHENTQVSPALAEDFRKTARQLKDILDRAFVERSQNNS